VVYLKALGTMELKSEDSDVLRTDDNVVIIGSYLFLMVSRLSLTIPLRVSKLWLTG